MTIPVFDSPQSALSFAVPQITHYEAKVYAVRYPEIRYPGLVPVDTSANPWTPSVTYFSGDIVGEAQWVNGGAGDVPQADVNRAVFNTPVFQAAIGYEFNEEELAQAKMLGIPLAPNKAMAARKVAEKFIDRVAMTGDADKGFFGLFNSPFVTVIPVPVDGGVSLWAQKTPAQILADVNGFLTGIYTGSDTVELADTLLLPPALFIYLSVTPFNAYSETTLLEYVRKANAYTAETGRPLTIRGVRGLEVAGAGSTPQAPVSRTIAYSNDEDVVRMHMPMPFQFGMLRLKAAWTFEVPGRFRLGGVDVRRPGAFRYMDGAS